MLIRILNTFIIAVFLQHLKTILFAKTLTSKWFKL